MASFGKGKEAVIDKSVRDAYVLDTNKCISSFQLSNTTVVEEIRALLVPDVINIRAELYKINIYTAPTGCFKAHVDTPRGGNMFGSLVVCLPSQFTGGALIARHRGQEVTYDWSTHSDNPAQKIRWAAFFSDVEHEILPVTEGHRVTMTYNLYNCDKVFLKPDIASPFYNSLKAAIGHPHFLRDGGVLGFACQHDYVFEHLNFDRRKKEYFDLLLKGSDRIVFSAARSLDLRVKVKPILTGYDWHHDEDFQYVGKKFEVSAEILNSDEEMDWREYFDDCDNAANISWCQWLMTSSQKLPSIMVPRYGNEPTVDICYQQAAILITVPKWVERRASSVTPDLSLGESSEANAAATN